MRRERSAAGGWGLGVADSRDGWLRPLGAAGGLGTRGGGWPQDLGARNRGGGRGSAGAAKAFARSPSATGKSPHPPQRVRSVHAAALGIQPLGPRF